MPNNETDFNKIPVKDWENASFKEFFKALENAERKGKKVFSPFSPQKVPNAAGIFWGARSYLQESHPYLEIRREKLYIKLAGHDFIETNKVDSKLQQRLFTALEKGAQAFTLSIQKTGSSSGAYITVAQIEPNLGYLQCDQNGFLNFETTVDFLIKCGEFRNHTLLSLIAQSFSEPNKKGGECLPFLIKLLLS